ncbi:MAG TPA: YdcF family protein [Chthonomonadaceae bacterium]|nr:YdcF family protein [Chthonomonadaceae bacterium]
MLKRILPPPKGGWRKFFVSRIPMKTRVWWINMFAPKGKLGFVSKIHWGFAAFGFILGVLIWIGALRLGIDAIPDLRSPHIVLLVGLITAAITHTKRRFIILGAGAIVTLGLLIVMYTPLVRSLVHGMVRSDPLEPADAIVVLSPDIQANGLLTNKSQASVFHAYELLCTKQAPTLVVTERMPPQPSCLPAIRLQMQNLKFDYPLLNAGKCENTHDEAESIAFLAHLNQWNRVIIVSHPMHMRRAAATFEASGLEVLCSPCPEGRYDLTSLSSPDDRLEAFRDWLHEAIGYQIYKMRGWITQ